MKMKSSEKMAEKKSTGEDPDDIVLVLRTRNQVYIDMVIAALDREGIPALLKSVAGYHGRGMLPFSQGFFDYLLYVTMANAEHAREIVQIIVPSEEME
jgi:hypothetical protein